MTTLPPTTWPRTDHDVIVHNLELARTDLKEARAAFDHSPCARHQATLEASQAAADILLDALLATR